MQTIIIIALVLAALATLGVLALGLYGMATRTTTPQQSQGLMQKRILFQGIAILLAILLLVIFGAGAGR
jgi:hypothetical protein